MFFGFFRLAIDTVYGIEQSRNDTDNPTAAAAPPTFRVYGPDGVLVASGTCTTFDSGTIIGAYKFSFSTSSPAFSRGSTYTVVVTYMVSSSARQSIHTFMVT